MSQPNTLTPTLTPVYSSSGATSMPASQPSPWGRLCARRTFLSSVDLYNDRYVLGRRADCDIVINGLNAVPALKQIISKVHLAISRDDTHVPYIQDLSKNGTYLNGQLLGTNQCATLCDGDMICVGFKQYEVYQFKDEAQTCLLDTKYKLTRLLGQGAFGEVYLAYAKKTCQRYAIKKIKSNDETHSKAKVLNEVNILSSLQHCCVIRMTDVVYGPGHVYIVLEYMEGGELQSRVLRHRYLAESLAKLYLYQMSLAVQYLHRQAITHRDLKPENVLLASTAPRTLLKLTDFGLSKVLGESCVMRTLCGTPLYLAPEILRTMLDSDTPYTAQVDVWSLGCIMYYMLYGHTPFQTNSSSRSSSGGGGDTVNNNNQHNSSSDSSNDMRRDVAGQLYSRITRGDYTIPSDNKQVVSEQAVSLIVEMLVVDPTKRITVDKLLKHRWLHDEEMRHTFTMLSTNNNSH